MKKIEIIKDKKFRGIYLSINFQIPIEKEKIANTLVMATVLPKINSIYKTEREIELELSNLYDASYGVSVDKIGDLYNIEYRLEVLSEKYLIDNEKIFTKALEVLKNIIFSPKVKNNAFENKYIDRQKEYFVHLIRKLKEDKKTYSIYKINELLSKGEPCEAYVYSDEEEIKKVTGKTVYNQYLEILEKAQIYICLAGNVEDYMLDEVKKLEFNNLNEYNYIAKREMKNEIIKLEEKQDVTQAILALAYRFENYNIEDSYKCLVMNQILGQGSNSKLFLNVREKNSMAYSISSSFKKAKGDIVIVTGINSENREKVEELVQKEIDNIKKGKIKGKEIDYAKSTLINNIKELDEDLSLISKKYLYNSILFGKNVTSIEMIQKINQVTLQDIIEMADNMKIQAKFFLKEND